MIASSQKQVVGVIEKRNNTTIMMEETQHNHTTTVDIDFDLSLSHYECGWFKCFIPSKSNQDIGYLLVLSEWSNHDAFHFGQFLYSYRDQTMEQMIGGWHLAQWIDTQFGDLPNGLHRHFFIDAPFFIPLNETVIAELCKFLLMNAEQICNKMKRKFASMKLENPSVVVTMDVPVQKVKKFEIDDFLPYKCIGPDNEKFNQKKDQYLNNVIKKGNGIEFYKNLKENYHTLQTMFKMKPIIVSDFHALFDTKGNMYFTDLDHDMSKEFVKSKKEKKTCLKGINGLIDKTKKILAKSQQELP